MVQALKSEKVRMRIHAAASLTAFWLVGKGVISNDDAIYVGSVLSIALAVDAGTMAYSKRKSTQDEF